MSLNNNTITTLIRLDMYPTCMPPLHSMYIMTEEEFETEYRQYFSYEETLKIKGNPHDLNALTSYEFELYLPETKITVIKDQVSVNSFKLLFKSKYIGNIDILMVLKNYYSINKATKRPREDEVIDLSDSSEDFEDDWWDKENDLTSI